MKRYIWRLWLAIAFSFIASTLLITDRALSSPLLRGFPLIAETTLTSSPSVEMSEMASPETATMNPSKPSEAEVEKVEMTQSPTVTQEGDLTEKVSQPQKTPSESGGPYDMEAIKEFNRALYGS